MADRDSSAVGKPGRGPLPPLPEDRRPRARAPRRPSSAQAEKSRGQDQKPREIIRALSLPPLQSEKTSKAADRDRVPRKPPPAAEPSSARPPKKTATSSPRAFQAEMDEWRRRNGVPGDAKVFSITGAFPGVRKALVARGWHENEDRQSPCWDLRYALWQRDLGEMNDLDDCQVVNYFARNAELTSKVGLCNSLYNCCTLDRVDVNSFYPRCYDLTTPAQAEHFVEDFKLTTCRCLLRRFVELGGRCAPDGIPWKAYPREVVQAALDVCRRQARAVDDSLDEAWVPAISDEEWAIVKVWSLKTPGKRVEDFINLVPPYRHSRGLKARFRVARPTGARALGLVSLICATCSAQQACGLQVKDLCREYAAIANDPGASPPEAVAWASPAAHLDRLMVKNRNAYPYQDLIVSSELG
ncbi:TTLL3C [Symbiodinium natans]|uniref:TTLL3C protein n=1 Tax=Symbiodinium natans TaxID=878477 RepID=A0A812M966_9DINO|nr:TTLL3C [Symbiodinium natans]